MEDRGSKALLDVISGVGEELLHWGKSLRSPFEDMYREVIAAFISYLVRYGSVSFLSSCFKLG